MKKFLVVLLSLGLIAGVSATASALDVSFSGSYQVEGAYESNVFQSGGVGGFFGGDTSRAAVWQRFRLQPVFKVAEGLSMTIRMDALEKQWGNTAWRGGSADDFSNSRRQTTVVAGNASGQKVQENIEFERSYVTFDTKIGQFQIGYQRQKVWGTSWGDWEQTGPRAMFTTKFGPMTMLALWDKSYEGDQWAQSTIANQRVDADTDQYVLAGIYNGKGWEAGLLYQYVLGAAPRLAAVPYKVKQHVLLPYVKATFGPVYLESEWGYSFGKAREYENETAVLKNQDVNAWGGYLKLKTTFGPAYFGAAGGYSSGDDLSDATKKKNVFNAKGWNPALILLGDDYLTDIFPGGNAYDAGHFSSYKNSAAGFMIANIFGGYNVTPKLNLEMSFTSGQFAVSPKTAAGVEYVSKNMGMELDVTATYKLYDNLTYMLGAGYLFTGDAFKGSNSNATIGNDYMLMNRLVLNF